VDPRTMTDGPTSPKPPRRWLPAAAVAALLAIPVVMWLSGSRPFAPADPIEIADAYIDARNAYDPVRVRELVSEDFRTSDAPHGWTGLSDIELAFESSEAWGFHYSDGTCAERETRSERIAVDCTYLWRTHLHEIGGFPPTPIRSTFLITDGRIDAVTSSSYDGDYWSRFLGDFLAQEDYADFQVLVVQSLRLEPEATREVIERLPAVLDLYEEWTRL
jgi:hypothetical protein